MRSVRVRRKPSSRTIKVPETLKIADFVLRAVALEFYREVESALSNGTRVTLDFGAAKNMHACGMLVLLAFVEVWQHKYPGRLFATYPEDEVVEQLMQHLGMMRRFGLSERTVVTHDRVKHWRFYSGNEALAGTYKDLSLDVRDSIEHPEAGLFADCLNEAVSNTVHHAYARRDRRLPPKAVRKWWMFSQYKDHQLTVAIFDCGVTIPESLREKPLFREYASMATFKDARLIKAAVRSERTRTRLGYRGKGLPEMLEFSGDLARGAMSISSRKGAWIYHAGTRLEQTKDFSDLLPGTLVLWEMPLREEQRDEPNNDLDSTTVQ